MRLPVSLMLLPLCAVASAAHFPVLDGERRATIVYQADAEAETVQAWQDLSGYLKQATSKGFITVSEDRYQHVEGAYPIYVGRVEALPRQDSREVRHMDRDAFLVHVTATEAFLVGPSPWATYWAVCRFLEDYAGVRWLIPGPLGEDVPQTDRIVVPETRRVYSPVILSRLWSGAHYGGVWSLRQRIHERYRFHHNLLNVFDPKHYDEHPEWFPLHGQERYRPGKEDHSWQPCFASESSVQHAADVAREAFAADRTLESYSYGCNDGQGWCECEGCRATDRQIEPWDGFDGSYSYRYYTWLNKVAGNLQRDHSDKMLGCLAYSTYIIPPEQIGLHKSIIPYLTSNRADYYEPEFRAQDQKLLEWWGRVANQMGIYDYAYGMGFAIPRIYSHLFQEAIRHAVKNKVKGFYAEVYPNWGLDGPKLYVMARLLWDPVVNVDRLTNEWNERMFREAAEPMKRHFARCERAWREQKTGRGHWAYRLAADPKQFEAFPPEVLDECTGYLEQAAALAKSTLVQERIAFFRKTWDVTLALAGGYWVARDVQKLLDENAPLDEVAKALRQMADKVATTDIDAYIKDKVGDDPIAFHPAKESWIAPLKAGAQTNAIRWSAAVLARAAVRKAQKAGHLEAAGIRREVDDQVRRVFGGGGSEAYRQAVAQIGAMASKVVTVTRAQAPPQIDGVLDDAPWQDADEIGGFSRWGQVTASEHPTRALLCHDGKDLYIALECAQDTSELKTEAAPRDGNTWHDDSVEIFINRSMGQYPWVQLIINAKGAFFDQWGQDDKQSYTERLAANFNCDRATKIEPRRWTAEIRVPLDELGCSPSGEPIRMEFVRNVQGKAEEISAWFPSIGAHSDELNRGWVVFE